MVAKGYRIIISTICIIAFLSLSFHVRAQHAADTVSAHPVDTHVNNAQEAFDAGHQIIHHVLDAHEFHFFSIGDFHATLPLPIILYSPTKGLTVFCSSKFGHEGHREAYKGYRMVDEAYIEHQKIAGVDAATVAKLKVGNIIAEDGSTVYDFSLTKNAAQMLIASILLVFLMMSVAKRAKKTGVNKAPTGLQNLIEPIILFVRDDVAKPNLSHKSDKYLPFLLTIFFFILINNLVALLPGAANAVGNIAFTGVLAIFAFIAILFSTNKHFWGHIFWPPGVPLPVKLILIPVELLSLFIKPAALMIRLFANMTAGHIIILSFISLIFIFGNMSQVAGIGFTPVSVAFSIFMYLIELLVAFIQAFIFTNLTAVFIGQSLESAHDEHH